jgi:hypothetical protein
MIYLWVVASGICLVLGDLTSVAIDSFLRRLKSHRQSTIRPGRRPR